MHIETRPASPGSNTDNSTPDEQFIRVDHEGLRSLVDDTVRRALQQSKVAEHPNGVGQSSLGLSERTYLAVGDVRLEVRRLGERIAKLEAAMN